MAHLARVAGADYSVSGGKILIDGTVHSIMVTKEASGNVAVNGTFTDNSNSTTSKTITITNDAFDWTKYKLKVLILKSIPTSGLACLLNACIVDGALFSGFTYWYNTTSGVKQIKTASINANENGVLTVTLTYTVAGGQTAKFCSPEYLAILEAIT